MLKWDDPVTFIHGLTTQQRNALKNLDVGSVGELLYLMPRRYDDFSRVVPTAQLVVGQTATIQVRIKDIRLVPTQRRGFQMIKATVSDASGSIGITWFNQPWLVKQLHLGTEIFLSGSLSASTKFGRSMTSPIWEPVSVETIAAGLVSPVYPLSGSLTQKTLRKIMKHALEEADVPPDPIPKVVRDRVGVLDLQTALRQLHRPATSEEAETARRRFAFEEFFIYQLALRSAKVEAIQAGAPAIAFDEAFAKRFVSQLPFALTDDQKKAIWAAAQDMQRDVPMRRLLQGDVGSGKTAVAAMLAAITFRAGSSAVLLAPTDLLAKQHAQTFHRFLGPHQIPVLLFTSGTKKIFEGADIGTDLKPAEAKERIAQGRIVVVGTHALLERGQSPPDTALAVVDEQHRFGVAQRETLVVAPREDGRVPHLLSMSATPIPRSLSLTLYGDLEVSIIRQKPAGRLPITTRVYVGEHGREEAYKLMREEIKKGHRIFIVCPLIDPSDSLGMKSVESEAKRLSQGPLRGTRIGILHGKVPLKDRDERMLAFQKGELDILVATTVIEVGVDVPEATVMAIEGAERFGLAQLHQLRGRVGRSPRPSHCLLIASDDAQSFKRLQIMEQTQDGFRVAEEDLRLRGSGNLFGTEQSGQAFQAARLNDLSLMTEAREISAEIVNEDPKLEKYPALKAAVEQLKQTSHQE